METKGSCQLHYGEQGKGALFPSPRDRQPLTGTWRLLPMVSAPGHSQHTAGPAPSARPSSSLDTGFVLFSKALCSPFHKPESKCPSPSHPLAPFPPTPTPRPVSTVISCCHSPSCSPPSACCSEHAVQQSSAFLENYTQSAPLVLSPSRPPSLILTTLGTPTPTPAEPSMSPRPSAGSRFQQSSCHPAAWEALPPRSGYP